MDVVRAVPPVPIVNTDYVPRFKRRVSACIDRAAVLLAMGAERRASDPARALAPTADAVEAREPTTEAGREALRRAAVHFYSPAAPGYVALAAGIADAEDEAASLRSPEDAALVEKPNPNWPMAPMHEHLVMDRRAQWMSLRCWGDHSGKPFLASERATGEAETCGEHGCSHDRGHVGKHDCPCADGPMHR